MKVSVCDKHGRQPFVNGQTCQACAYERFTGRQVVIYLDASSRKPVAHIHPARSA